MSLCEHIDHWLIDGWRQAHKLWRVRFSILGAAASYAATQWPNLAPYVPPRYVPCLFIAGGILSMVRWNRGAV